MRLPDFLIIGAAKSATTTLYTYLSQHPQIYMSPIKEPQFFAIDEIYSKGLEYYASLFSGALPHQICGEASTNYTKYPQYPKTTSRIAETIPKIKMIYIMRHPVERAYSYYVHLNRNLKFQETFEEQINRTSVCLDGSNYMMQIEQYLPFFPKKSFLFLLMDDLINFPQKTLAKVCSFLGINENPDFFKSLEGKSSIHANSADVFFQDTIRGKITQPLKKINLLVKVAYLLPQAARDFFYETILKNSLYGQSMQNTFQNQYSPYPMKPETRKILIDKFRPLNQKLETFIERDLSHWNQ